MVVLDTDHMSLLEWGISAEQRRLLTRLANLNTDEVATTIMSFEEQTRGWLAYLARARTLAQQIEAYRRLNRQLDNYRRVQVLEFDEIAAIALAHHATLLSRNLRDFRRVPDLRVEDWTA